MIRSNSLNLKLWSFTIHSNLWRTIDLESRISSLSLSGIDGTRIYLDLRGLSRHAPVSHTSLGVAI